MVSSCFHIIYSVVYWLPDRWFAGVWICDGIVQHFSDVIFLKVFLMNFLLVFITFIRFNFV